MECLRLRPFFLNNLMKLLKFDFLIIYFDNLSMNVTFIAYHSLVSISSKHIPFHINTNSNGKYDSR